MTPRHRTAPTELVPSLSVSASAVLGAVLGDAAYYVATGRAAPSFGALPAWMLIAFAAAAIGFAVWWKGPALRVGLVLFAISQSITLAPTRTLSMYHWFSVTGKSRLMSRAETVHVLP